MRTNGVFLRWVRGLVASTAVACCASSVADSRPVAAELLSLRLPIACRLGDTCFIQNYVDHDTSPHARDYQCGSRTYDGHDGTDFRLPSLQEQQKGVDVLAAASGVVMAVRDGMDDLSVRVAGTDYVQGRECGNGVVVSHGDGWETQYCHLARGSLVAKRGERLAAGARLGRVGQSGKTEFPHLHFAVRRNGKSVDPFAYEAAEGVCAGGTWLWEPAIRADLAYRGRQVINAGFASGPVSMEEVETGAARRHILDRDSHALVAYGRAIGLEAGDFVELTILAPDGTSLAEHRQAPLDQAKAQWFVMVGRKRAHGAHWQSGLYTAIYRVRREEKTLLEKTFTIEIQDRSGQPK